MFSSRCIKISLFSSRHIKPSMFDFLPCSLELYKPCQWQSAEGLIGKRNFSQNIFTRIRLISLFRLPTNAIRNVYLCQRKRDLNAAKLKLMEQCGKRNAILIFLAGYEFTFPMEDNVWVRKRKHFIKGRELYQLL